MVKHPFYYIYTVYCTLERLSGLAETSLLEIRYFTCDNTLWTHAPGYGDMHFYLRPINDKCI